MGEELEVCKVCKKSYLLGLLLFFFGATHAQPNDTLEVFQLFSEAQQKSNFSKQDSLFRLAWQKAQQLNRVDYQIKILTLWSFSHQQRNNQQQALQQALRAVELGLKKAQGKNESLVRDAITNLALCYLYINRLDSMAHWVKIGKSFAHKTDWFNYSILLSLEAELYFDDVEKSERVYDSALSIASLTPSLHDDVMAAFNKVTFLQVKKSEWGKSLELLTSFRDVIDQPSLRYEPITLSQRRTFFYRSAKNTFYALVGITYVQLFDFDNACYYMQLVAKNYQDDDNPFLTYVLSDLAVFEYLRNNQEKSRQLFDSARREASHRLRSDSLHYASFYFLRGWEAEQNGLVPEAIRNYEKSMEVTEAYFPRVAILKLFQAYWKHGMMADAERIIHRVKTKLSPNEIFTGIMFHKELGDYYSARGDADRASQNYLKYYHLKDSIVSATRYYTVKEIETRLKVAEKEKELAQAQREGSLQATLLEQKRVQLIGVVTGLVLLSFLSVALFKNYRVKQRQAHELEKRNDRIETLIRELHHRVKNNMQTISSLLSLQSIRIADENAKLALREGQTRVEAMSLIHQKLYLDSDLRGVDMEEYLKALVQTLAQSYGYNPSVVRSEIAITEKNLDVDIAIPLGLIINELMINAFKYAFDKVENPELQVVLKRKENQNLALLIRDNGKGLPDAWLQKTKADSFGLRLVQTLSRQLNASLSTYNDGGAVFEFEVKMS